MRRPLTSVFLLVFFSSKYGLSGPAGEGEPCISEHDRLDLRTHRFTSQCGETTFCAVISNLTSGTNETTSSFALYNQAIAQRRNADRNVSQPGTSRQRRQETQVQEETTPSASYGLVSPTPALQSQDTSAQLPSASLLDPTSATKPSETSASSTSTSQPLPTPDGICTRRLCRRDEFPFGYGPNDALPPLCAPGFFCPDEGSGCQPLVPLGGLCQLGRDEQCALPYPGLPLWNSSSVLCLQSICTYANRTSNQPCTSDATTYTAFAQDGQLINVTISRDTCVRPAYFCGASQTCEQTRLLSMPCSADHQCASYNCAPLGVCVPSPETPYHVAPWQYAVTIICVVGALLGTVTILTLVHRRHRRANYTILREYYLEQISLRRAIISLHSSANYSTK
ncbi:hypothetical protein HGRIS_004477 [Hohenbuehelia grisea]|uniref:Uncharacterized protein n=1 Tax=Hohenbuehelia grisea TaxID=104357 RepID=A0ABR3JBZ7_9AGAR